MLGEFRSAGRPGGFYSRVLNGAFITPKYFVDTLVELTWMRTGGQNPQRPPEEREPEGKAWGKARIAQTSGIHDGSR